MTHKWSWRGRLWFVYRRMLQTKFLIAFHYFLINIHNFIYSKITIWARYAFHGYFLPGILSCTSTLYLHIYTYTFASVKPSLSHSSSSNWSYFHDSFTGLHMLSLKIKFNVVRECIPRSRTKRCLSVKSSSDNFEFYSCFPSGVVESLWKALK